jgi:hypothetical protein
VISRRGLAVALFNAMTLKLLFLLVVAAANPAWRDGVSALAEFQAAYAKAQASGQAVAFAPIGAPSSQAPSESSTSYQTFGNWYA